MITVLIFDSALASIFASIAVVQPHPGHDAVPLDHYLDAGNPT